MSAGNSQTAGADMRVRATLLGMAIVGAVAFGFALLFSDVVISL